MVKNNKAMYPYYTMEKNDLPMLLVYGNDTEWVNFIYLGSQLTAGGFISEKVTCLISLASLGFKHLQRPLFGWQDVCVTPKISAFNVTTLLCGAKHGS